MTELKLNTIGRIERGEGDIKLVLDKTYADALIGLDGFKTYFRYFGLMERPINTALGKLRF